MFPAPPHLIEKPQDVQKFIDDSLVWECKATGKPKPSYRWMKNGENLESTEVKSAKCLQAHKVLNFGHTDTFLQISLSIFVANEEYQTFILSTPFSTLIIVIHKKAFISKVFNHAPLCCVDQRNRPSV